MGIRRIFEIINHVHSTSAPICSILGAMYGGSKAVEYYDKNNKFGTNMLENLIICSPEATIGGIAGYYWVYTLPIVSFYLKFKR
jgi:hypothetical protein